MYEGLQGVALNTLCSAVSAVRQASLTSTAADVRCVCCSLMGRVGGSATSVA